MQPVCEIEPADEPRVLRSGVPTASTLWLSISTSQPTSPKLINGPKRLRATALTARWFRRNRTTTARPILTRSVDKQSVESTRDSVFALDPCSGPLSPVASCALRSLPHSLSHGHTIRPDVRASFTLLRMGYSTSSHLNPPGSAFSLASAANSQQQLFNSSPPLVPIRWSEGLNKLTSQSHQDLEESGNFVWNPSVGLRQYVNARMSRS